MIFLVVTFFIFIFLFASFFIIAIRKIKKQHSNDIDIITWLRVVFDNASEEDIAKYKKYEEFRDKKEKEKKDFENRINKLKEENQNIERIMLVFDELTNKYPYYYYFLEKADLYIENKLYDKAFLEYKKAINSITGAEFYFHKSYAYHLISNMYFNIQEYSKALRFASKAINVHRGGHCHIDYDDVDYFYFNPLMYSKEMAYEDRAEIYFKLKKKDLALKDVKKANELSKNYY